MTPHQMQLCFPQWQGELQIPVDALSPTDLGEGTEVLKNKCFQAGSVIVSLASGKTIVIKDRKIHFAMKDLNVSSQN